MLAARACPTSRPLGRWALPLDSALLHRMGVLEVEVEVEVLRTLMRVR